MMNESKQSKLVNINDDKNNDFLLSQLQRRLLALVKKDSISNKLSVQNIQSLKDLIEIIYHSQNSNLNIVSYPTLEAKDIDINILKSKFPMLISDSDESRPTPIIIFPPFVAFRRNWLELIDIVSYLKRGGKNNSINKETIKKINWQITDANNNIVSISDEQKLASISAATLPFCVITGGAGTGKTTTLVKALEILLLDNSNCEILLSAPTGKAAHRLNESINKQLELVHNSVKPLIKKLQAKTIHRIIGISENTGRVFHNIKNPIYCDVLVIDESSMIGSDIFILVQQAIMPYTHVILLGDADQLPAINSSSFFNDISRLPVGYSPDFCQMINPYLNNKIKPAISPMKNAICHLTKSHRFIKESKIDKTANAILEKDIKSFFSHLASDFYDLSILDNNFIYELIKSYPTKRNELLSSLNNRIILSANRQGRFGSAIINNYLDKSFRKILFNDKNMSAWYEGRRIIIEQNDYHLGLNNGDIGYCHWINDRWKIIFDDNRHIDVSSLLDDKYSLAFAISIHKSQGSEYQHVDIVLDSFDIDNINQIINQPLLYTAVTRAKKSLTIYTDKQMIEHALSNINSEPSPLIKLMSE